MNAYKKVFFYVSFVYLFHVKLDSTIKTKVRFFLLTIRIIVCIVIAFRSFEFPNWEIEW